ncbi:hypothetical protein Pmar_PMAR028383 [Perkinsus marinus ATCC 50983]|uniref:U-box domain-containing protein n=1 Tax=Perkinsus marinus (strain ATCC 50983 / TXsc) TaxID=423536 RepID=C5KBN9_PERM5|nr:hypothetical protein Pmar_PMAR028383 [Perkinsus marinus ATCC 50983]EER18109.1 hypothetical protein Pmar_PMAR028383 [Perkinsus marinus ATCC 50983]|eukprot:XP_002786313.1 hypothetical protein Pmar_PMAR028383 [Perkinsus marinus ATCC 50983]
MNPEHHHNDLGYKNTSTSSGWSHLVPNVVNCLSRDYYYNKKSASDTPQDRRVERKTPSAGIEVLKTTVSAAEQRMEDRQRAEDFLLFMDKAEAPQLAPSPLLSQSTLTTVTYSAETYHNDEEKPCLTKKERKPQLPLPSPAPLPPSRSAIPRAFKERSLDVGERQPVVVGPLVTVCSDEGDDVIGQTLCAIPPFLKGHSVAIRITVDDFTKINRGKDTPLSICVGLTTGPQLYRERGMVVSFCSSHSEIKHTRPREVSANTVNPQSLELEAAVISESRVRFHGERHFWIIWGEGLLFAVGLAGSRREVGSRLLLAADTASSEYTFGFNEHVSELICSIIEYDVVDSFGRCVCQHQRSHANTDILMKAFMTLIHNCLLYCSSHHQQLRQHLAIKSNIIPDILLPYIENILPVFMEADSSVGVKSIEWANLTSALQTLAIATFNVKTFRKPVCRLQRSELLSRVASLKQLKEAPVTLVILMKVAINCNYGASQHWDAFAEASRAAYDGMDETSPIDWDVPEDQARDGQKGKGAWLIKVRRPRGDYKSRRRNRRRWKRGNPFKRVSRVPDMDDMDDEEEGQQAGAQQDATRPDEGGDGEQAMIYNSEKMLVYDTRIKCAGLVGLGCQAEALADFAKEEDEGAPKATTEINQEETLEETNHSLLGDLPEIRKEKQGSPTSPSKPKHAVRIRRTSQMLVNAPAELKCALDGKIMTNPIRSPYGHVFEKKTLEKWFDSCGEVCPITEKALSIDDCQTAHDIKKAIVRYVKEKEEANLQNVA